MKRQKTSFQIGTLPIVAEWTATPRGNVSIIHSLKIVGDHHHDITAIVEQDEILWDLFVGYIILHSNK